jgi:outer membrane protein insertion porin family
MKKILLLLSLISFLSLSSQNKVVLDYANPQEYNVGGITVAGNYNYDANTIKVLSGLAVGDRILIPGDKIARAIKNLWEQGLFSDVKINIVKIYEKDIFLEIEITEKSRLSKFKFTGLKKSEADNVREDIKLVRGKVITENVKVRSAAIIKKYFIDKGFLHTNVEVFEEPDTTLADHIILTFKVDKGNRVKIKDINFYGNKAIKSSKLRAAMKETKRARVYNIFHSSKLIQDNYDTDLKKVIEKYNEKGYRDAFIKYDTIYFLNDDFVTIDITIDEGNPYYFRNIEFVGNTKYKTKDLKDILGIKKGDIYNKKLLDTRLSMDPNGRDISSLYLDDGYLFFSADAVEKTIENDSIDFEIRIYEGRQATINRVIVKGNTKTNDHVILREIRTRPGQLFSRSDIIRTQRELAQLGYFDAEQLAVNPIPNQESGTVDIEYTVAEKPSDQIELSAGWGGNRVVGTLGLTFNNFSTRNVFKKGTWTPLPSGDGQRLSLRAQTTGTWFQSYNMSFTEPWLGGKKPNSLTFSVYHSFFSENGQSKWLKDANNKFVRDDDGNKIKNITRAAFKSYGSSIGLGTRLKWPDDFFTAYGELGYQYFVLENSNSQFVFSDGFANNLYVSGNISRNSIDQPIYPRSGSQTSLTLQITPPYSLFRPKDFDYNSLEISKRYNLLEYHKWKFQSQWFMKLAGNLVLQSKAGFGYLGYFNKDLGAAPFERFYLGGDGLTNFQLDGREIIALRGYDNGSLSPRTGAAYVQKFNMELRYPFTLNPSATIYGLAYAEAGSSWLNFNNYRPFELYRSAGVGIRIFMPMFGLLGLDWGYPLDLLPGQTQRKGQVHFTIGGNINGW